MYKHSVRIDQRRCVGCTSCIKTCPTEAIRVQNGKAHILDDRCIDCGRCMIYCHHHAMVSVTTPMSALNEFKYNIVIPSTALYMQFKQLYSLDDVYSALYAMGFHAIYEEAKAAEILAEALRLHIRTSDAVYPVISTNCPVIPRLVTTLYPNLIDNLSPFLPTNEIAARIARVEFSENMGVPGDEIGVYYISPCSSQMTQLRTPLGIKESAMNGVFGVREIYAQIVEHIGKTPGMPRTIQFPAGAFGLGTAVIGGLSSAVGTEHYLAVDGTHASCQCLDAIESEHILGLHLLEAAACNGGCVGGPLNFENQFVAKNRTRRLANSQPRLDLEADEHIQKYVNSPLIRYETEFKPHNIMKLSDDVVEAMCMMDKLEEITKTLPGLDCGSCGSPTCRTLAEDIVLGSAVEMDCIFKLRDKVRLMAQEMVDLASAQKRG
ncbi:MAG: [Fe-Fe] hydrogenase large subunit C-terminal domain-containing protein [Clostridia bacterium]